MTRIWKQRDEGHMVAVEIVGGVVVRAMLVIGEDLDAIIEHGISDEMNDADLAEMVDMSQDEFDYFGG